MGVACDRGGLPVKAQLSIPFLHIRQHTPKRPLLPSFRSYAANLGFNELSGFLLAAPVNFSSVPGKILMGPLADHYSITNVIIFSTIGSTLSIFLFLGFSPPHLVALILFAITCGFLGGGLSSTWSGSQKELKREQEGLDKGSVFGILAGGEGLGNVVDGCWICKRLGMDWRVGRREGEVRFWDGVER